MKSSSLAMNWDESFLNDNLNGSSQISRYLKKLLVHTQTSKERKGQSNIANLVYNIRLFRKYFKIWHEFINDYKYKNRSRRKISMKLFANPTYETISISYNNNYHIRKEILTTKRRSYFSYWKKYTKLRLAYKYLSALHNNRILTSAFGIWLISYDQSVGIHTIGMRLYKQTKRRLLSYYFSRWLSEKRSVTQYMRKQYESVLYRWQAYKQRVYMLRNYHKSKLKTYYKVYKHKQYNKVFTLLRSIYVNNQCILYTQDIYNNNILKSGFKQFRFMTLYNGNSSVTYQQQSIQNAIINYNKYKIKKYMYIWHKYITDKHMNKWLYNRYFLVQKGSKFLGFWSHRTILHTSRAKETLGVKYFKTVSVRRCFKLLRERLNSGSNNNSTRRRRGNRPGYTSIEKISSLPSASKVRANISKPQAMLNSSSAAAATTLTPATIQHPTTGSEPRASHRRRDKDSTNDDVMRLLNEMNSYLKSGTTVSFGGDKQQTHASSSSPSPRQSGTTPLAAAATSTRRELFTTTNIEPVSHQPPQSVSPPTSTRTTAAASTHKATTTTATTAAAVSAPPSSSTHTRPTIPHQGTVLSKSSIYRDAAIATSSSSGNTLSHIEYFMLYRLIYAAYTSCQYRFSQSYPSYKTLPHPQRGEISRSARLLQPSVFDYSNIFTTPIYYTS